MAGVRVVLMDEAGRICLVRHGYGTRAWNVPGGGIDQGESVLEAAVREVREETGIEAKVESLIGLYSVPGTRDLIAVFRASIVATGEWAPNTEIVEVRFCAPDALPEPIHPCILRCLDDAVAGCQGMVRELAPDGTVIASLAPDTEGAWS